VQNAAARVLTRSRKYDHNTTFIISTLVKFHINYNVLLLTYKALNGLAPVSLRSLNLRLLVIHRIYKYTKGGRVFSHLAPKLWNNLPDIVRGSDSLPQYKTRLKTHIFSQAFTCLPSILLLNQIECINIMNSRYANYFQSAFLLLSRNASPEVKHSSAAAASPGSSSIP